MEIISRLNPSVVSNGEGKTSAEQVRDTEATARALASRAAGAAEFNSGASQTTARLLELRGRAAELQDGVSRVQTEQSALRTIREQLSSQPDPATLGKQLQQALSTGRYNGEQLVELSIGEMTANPDTTIAKVDQRLKQLEQRGGELTGQVNSLLVATENVIAAAGPVAAGENISSLISDLRNALPASPQQLFSGLTPEGVGALL